MFGPNILVTSLSKPLIEDRRGLVWQYHSRSDRHSKIASWALLFDLLCNCALLRDHVEAKKVGFGINHQMRDFKTGRKKDLDLVICTPGSEPTREYPTFITLVDEYGISFTSAEQSALASLPPLVRTTVGSVHLAVEAKAVMTAHIKALPRLYDELNSSHQAIHGSADFAIAAGFVVINSATRFISPDLNKSGEVDRVINTHRQPKDVQRAVDKVLEIPRRTQAGTEGFDALGVVVVEMVNDGSPVTHDTRLPAPQVGDVIHYDEMVRRIGALYATKFGNV